MCLTVDEEATFKAKQCRNPEDFVVKYKIVRLIKKGQDYYGGKRQEVWWTIPSMVENCIASFNYYHIWKVGINKASGVNVNVVETPDGPEVHDSGDVVSCHELHHAIHVYYDENVAKTYLPDYYNLFAMMKVYCQNKHLIGLNANEEAYSQVTLKQEDYDSLMERFDVFSC